MGSMTDARVPGDLDSPESLVPLARAGDRIAFARIVRLHRTAMVRVAYVVAGDRDLAVDAVGMAWPVASGRLGDLRDPAGLGSWLCGIAALEARSLARRRRARTSDPGLDATDPGRGEADPGGGAADPELARSLASLTVDERLLLALRHVGGSTPEELARVAGLPVTVALARLASLEARLDDGRDDRRDDGRPDRLGERIRTHAAIPVRHIDIDVEARRAIVTRNDDRIQVASVAIALVAAVALVSISYLAGDRTLPMPGVGAPASPSPSPTTDPAESTPAPDA
jgi:DNA-directed RNA polymerase specialized sigma24 family protein